MLFVGLLLVACEDFIPLIGGDRVFIASVVPDCALRFVHCNLNFALGCAELLSDSFFHALLLSHELGIAAKQNVRTATGHVGRDGDHAFAAGLRDDFGFFFVVLRIEHHVLNAFFLQQVGKPLGFLDRCCADQHRLPSVIELLNLIRRSEILFFFGPVHEVGVLDPAHRLVRRDNQHIQVVDFAELGCFRFRRAGHAGQLLVHAEIILESNGRERLVLALDLHAFFRFDRLVQAIGPAAARHQTPGEFIHNDDFTVFDHVFHITVIQRIGLNRGFYVMLQVPKLRIGDVANAQKLLDFFPSFISDDGIAMLFIDDIVAGHLFGLAGSARNRLAFLQLWNDAVHARIFVGGFLAGARNNQRGAGFVDQD